MISAYPFKGLEDGVNAVAGFRTCASTESDAGICAVMCSNVQYCMLFLAKWLRLFISPIGLFSHCVPEGWWG